MTAPATVAITGPGQEQPQMPDIGLATLALVASYYRMAVDPGQLAHELALSGRASIPEDLVRGEPITVTGAEAMRRFVGIEP